jgi:hypothetical protein
MPATTNKFEALAESEGPATGGGKQCTDDELLAAVLAAKAAHPDYGLARLIKDAHGWELLEKRVEKVLGVDGRGHAASAPPQEGSKTKSEPPGPRVQAIAPEDGKGRDERRRRPGQTRNAPVR